MPPRTKQRDGYQSKMQAWRFVMTSAQALLTANPYLCFPALSAFRQIISCLLNVKKVARTILKAYHKISEMSEHLGVCREARTHTENLYMRGALSLHWVISTFDNNYGHPEFANVPSCFMKTNIIPNSPANGMAMVLKCY